MVSLRMMWPVPSGCGSPAAIETGTEAIDAMCNYLASPEMLLIGRRPRSSVSSVGLCRR